MIPVHAYNPVQIHMTTYTNTSQTQIQYKLDDARKNTHLNTNTMKMPKTPESYAHEPVAGKHQSEKRTGLGPLVAAGPREVCRPPRVAKEVAGPKKEREEGLMYVALSLVEMEVMVCWILMEKKKEGDGFDDESDVSG